LTSKKPSIPSKKTKSKKTKNKNQTRSLADQYDENKVRRSRSISSEQISDSFKTPTIVTQKRVSSVSSTSSKAGLSFIKNTKLKRLWPDSSVFSKRILKWSPPAVVCVEDGPVRFRGPINFIGNKVPLSPIPATFRDSPDMIKHITPHILEEGLMSLHQEFTENSKDGWWTRNSFTLFLRNCTPVEPRNSSTSSSPSVRLYEFAFYFDPKKNTQRPPTNLGEIFAIYSPSWKQSFCCLGFIGSNDINSTFLTDQKVDNDDSFDLCKLWICVSNSSIENSGWLPESEMPSRRGDGSFSQQKMYAMNIGTCTDMMRQYEALKSLDCIRPNLKKAIFCDAMERPSQGDKIMSTVPPQPEKPSSVISQVWDMVSKQTNPYQLSALESIMSAKAKHNITLLQGPPGTGKTHTIVALVSALLNGSVPISGAKNPRTAGTKVQIGRALSNAENKPLLNVNVAKRILICSPSNHTVDDLAWKLHKKAIGYDGKIGSFNITRFGMLPDEDRHDGRGRSNFRNRNKALGHATEREKFLHAINLDNIVTDIACGKEVNDFAHRKDARSRVASSSKRQSRFINFSVERQKILSQCHVICTTLSGSGSKAFAEAVSRDEFPQSEFDAVIIDEACQGSEMSCLIPLKFNPNAVVLVGDPNQLPVTTFSSDAERCYADRSLFERLNENGWPIQMLRIQYRMHDDIALFPSKTFYDSTLITSECVKSREIAPWHQHTAFPPYLVWDLPAGKMEYRNRGFRNIAEANFSIKLLYSFSNRFRGLRDLSIGIISFYNDQVSLIKDQLRKNKALIAWINKNNILVQISTVDGFQGAEKDIIILSCVRSRWFGQRNATNIGFLKDFRRVNVALTRARQSLWILGNSEILKSDALWNDLISDARSRQLIAQSSILSFLLNENNSNPMINQRGIEGGRNHDFVRKRPSSSSRKGNKRNKKR